MIASIKKCRFSAFQCRYGIFLEIKTQNRLIKKIVEKENVNSIPMILIDVSKQNLFKYLRTHIYPKNIINNDKTDLCPRHEDHFFLEKDEARLCSYYIFFICTKRYATVIKRLAPSTDTEKSLPLLQKKKKNWYPLLLFYNRSVHI